MKTAKRLILVAPVVLTTACASIGPKVVIDTPEPAEDILVLCEKSKDHLIGHNASSYIVVDSVHVVKSSELVDCGIEFFGDAFGVNVSHPIYVGDGTQNYMEGDVKHIVLNKTKLDRLNEQKAKFEAGYWDKYSNPGLEYASNLTGCGFDYQYFDYYKKVKKLDVNHFKNMYQSQMLECFKRSFSITKKYDPQIGRQLPSAEEWMNRLWQSDVWKQ